MGYKTILLAGTIGLFILVSCANAGDIGTPPPAPDFHKRLMEDLFGGAAIILFVSMIMFRAGFSKWWGILSLIPAMSVLPSALIWLPPWGIYIFNPLVGLVVLIVFLWRDWPIEREARNLRVRCGIGNEQDAYFLLDEAKRLEEAEKYDDAVQKCQQAITNCSGAKSRRDAERYIEGLNVKIAKRNQSGVSQ